MGSALDALEGFAIVGIALVVVVTVVVFFAATRRDSG